MPRAPRPKNLCNGAGFSLSEALVSLSVLGVLATVALPTAWTFLPAATTQGAAREIQAVLYQARMVAIQTRQSICVRPAAGGLKLLKGTCEGPAWIGHGTNGSGVIALPNDVTWSGPSPVFTPFGTASTSGALTVYHGSGDMLTVTVRPSGQVTIP
jgi:Tfp pilus assembly protein FimT